MTQTWGGFVNDGIGQNLATADPLPFDGDAINFASAVGTIVPKSAANPNPTGSSNYTDDYWSVESAGEAITITVNPGRSTITPGVADPGATLNASLEILNSAGIAIATAATPALSETLSLFLAAGDYYVEVLAAGNAVDTNYTTRHFFDMGDYFLSGSVVPQMTTTTSVTSSNSPASYGQQVTFTANVTPASGNGETGTVQFQIDGSNAGGPVPLNSNTATYVTSSLAVGNHSVIAVYSGDTNFSGSTSPAFIQTITAAVQLPAVTRINPTSGSTAGGTVVTIKGTNFTGATAVYFGGVEARSFTVNSITQITATSPAGLAGAVDVKVTTAGGTSTTSSTDQFIYQAVNHQPNTPMNSLPINGAANTSLTPTLTASAFSDPDIGDAQAAAEWVITRISDDAPMVDSGTDTIDLTSWSVPSGLLANNTEYSWKVRYEDNHSAWSSYSAATTFTTVALTSPQAVVQVSGATLANGQSAPVIFPTIQQGQAGPALTFTIKNTGAASLILGSLSVPSEYTITSNLSSPLAAGSQETFSIQMDATTAGTFAGNISCTTGDPQNPTYSFPITGTVLAPAATTAAASQDVWITSVYDGGGQVDSTLRIGGWGDEYDSLVQFDLTNLPKTATSAMLYLYCFADNSASTTAANLYNVTGGWNMNTKWPGPSAQYVSNVGTPNVGSWFSIDLTTLYNAWQNGSATNNGIELRPANNDDNFDEFYSTSYTGDTSLWPKLVVTGAAPYATAADGKLSIDAGMAGGPISLSENAGYITVNAAAGNYSFTVASLNSMIVTGTNGNDTLNINSSLDIPVTFNGGIGADILNIDAGSFTFENDPSSQTGNLTVNDNSDIKFAFSGNGSVAALNLGPRATATLESGIGTLSLNSLSIGTDGTFDIRTGKLSLNYTGTSPVGDVAAMIGAGYKNGKWTGTGITSSAAATDPTHTTGVGYFNSGTQIKIARTWNGDANLDGVINADDFAWMMNGKIAGGTRWQDGNFNYDSKVNADDWMQMILAAAYSKGQMLNSASLNSEAVVQRSSALIVPSRGPLVDNSSAGVFAQIPIDKKKDLMALIDSPLAGELNV